MSQSAISSRSGIAGSFLGGEKGSSGFIHSPSGFIHSSQSICRRGSSSGFIHHDKGSVWHQVLSSVRTRTAEKHDAHIILIGNMDVGKSTLLRSLQDFGFVETPGNLDYYQNTNGVSGVDYAYINVRDLNKEEDIINADVVGRTNVWILQNNKYKDMLIDRLKGEDMNHMLGMICIDLGRSWEMISQLNKWFSCLYKILSTLINTLSVEQQDALRNKLSQYINSYRRYVNEVMACESPANTNTHLFHTFNTFNNPIDNEEGGGGGESSSSSVLFNMGIPIVVVVCKSDMYTALDTKTTQGYIDVIQAYLRKVCLPYGSAIFFTSCKDPQQPKNVFLLYRYLMHLLYGFPFREAGDMTSKDALFIPSGFDSEELIMQFAAKTIVPELDKPYETIVTKPVAITGYGEDLNKNMNEEPMDDFLSKILLQFPSSELRLDSAVDLNFSKENVSQLSSPSTQIKGEKSVKMPPRRASAQTASIMINAEGANGGAGARNVAQAATMPPPKRGDSKDAASLQSFFQNLLTKNRGKGSGTPRDRTRRERPERTSAGDVLQIISPRGGLEKEKPSNIIGGEGEKEKGGQGEKSSPNESN